MSAPAPHSDSRPDSRPESRPAGDVLEGAAGPEDFDVVKWLLLLWARRKWILASAMLCGLLGTIVAYHTEPVYRADTILTPRAESGSARVLSQLGGLGRIMATSIEAGNTPLDRLELIATSRSLALSIIENEPEYLQVLFPHLWDEERGEWRSGREPNRFSAAMMLRGRFLTVTTDRRKNVMNLHIEAPDPELAFRLVNSYINGMNVYIRESVRRSAAQSREYLESELGVNHDPRIRNQIIQLIANEIEKAALVAAQSFDVVEAVWMPRAPIKPQKKRIIQIAILAGFLLGPLGVIAFEKGRDIQAYLRSRIRKLEG